MQNFFGYYLKCQNEEETVAFIVGRHKKDGEVIGFLQIVTDEGTWKTDFPAECFEEKKNNIYLANNRFGKNGIRVNIVSDELRVKGKLDFSNFTPIKYDIMGPFALVPFMECRHYVMSMQHTVNGMLYVNERRYVFEDAFGYWEGDGGNSFPKEYLWTQTAFDGGSLMLSVAEIPAGPANFTGIIGIIMYEGKEYRLATYSGAKIKELSNRKVHIVQGNLSFEAKLMQADAKELPAPVDGEMQRTIHESLECVAAYRFKIDGETVIALKTNRASFEYEYQR